MQGFNGTQIVEIKWVTGRTSSICANKKGYVVAKRSCRMTSFHCLDAIRAFKGKANVGKVQKL